MRLQYKTGLQIQKIRELEQQARELNVAAVAKLKEADSLTKELKSVAGEQFIHDNIAYRYDHAAIGMGQVGNRDWLGIDNSVRILKESE